MTEEFDAEFYKKTVFLPQTDFDMRAGLATKEPKILEEWEKAQIFNKLRDKSKTRKPWILHDGPPYANGHLHMGHAVNKILKDVINRAAQMDGYDANYVPGWDCHGLPIEWKIEEQYREKGLDKDSVDPLVFRQECRDFAQKWVDIQSEEFQRLGVVGDWENPYLTMTKEAESKIAGEIHRFLLNGGLYKGVKPVMWSVVEKTALAEAEVEYKEHKSVTIWIKFPVVQTNLQLLEGASIVIWTTTPWTMPSNRAVAFARDVEYAVYTVEEVEEGSGALVGDRLALAVSLADGVKEQAKITAWGKSESFTGADVQGTVCQHPLRAHGYDFDVPALEGDFVTDDAGTGFVHIAPGHGADDFMLGMQHGVEVTDNVSDDGKFRDHVPLFAGLEVYTQEGKLGDGNFAVLKAMKDADALLAKGSLRHEYPHSWRSKAPLIFRTTPQWFISMENNSLREKALSAIEQTRWVPEQGENRIRAMIAQRPDWCISRQRAWGVPIAIFVDKKTGEPLRDEAVCERIAQIFEEEGSDAWYARDAQDFLGNQYSADDYDQVFDVVDVWFESGSTHAFVLEARDNLHSPADLYLEGSDQHRGWFHSSLLESCGTRGVAPYKTVLTHGFVLDEKGYKMSKSLGNTIAPQDICDEYGADILRLWTVLSDYSEDIRIGEKILKTTTDLYRRIRNTLRFLLGALDGFSTDEAVNVLDPEIRSAMPELERYVMHRMTRLQEQLTQHRHNYDYGKYMQAIHNFCAIELSALYFDVRKDRLYCDRPDMLERRICRSVLAHVFEALETWLAPVLAFTTFEAWTMRPKGYFNDAEQDNIHLMDFVTLDASWKDEALEQKWSKLLSLRKVALGAIEKARNNKDIGGSLEADLEVYVPSEWRDLVAEQDLAELCIVSQYSVSIDPAPQEAFTLNDVSGVGVVVQTALGEKCQRCWKILPEVGSHPVYKNVSLRDADAVEAFLKQQKERAA